MADLTAEQLDTLQRFVDGLTPEQRAAVEAVLDTVKGLELQVAELTTQRDQARAEGIRAAAKELQMLAETVPDQRDSCSPTQAAVAALHHARLRLESLAQQQGGSTDGIDYKQWAGEIRTMIAVEKLRATNAQLEARVGELTEECALHTKVGLEDNQRISDLERDLAAAKQNNPAMSEVLEAHGMVVSKLEAQLAAAMRERFDVGTVLEWVERGIVAASERPGEVFTADERVRAASELTAIAFERQGKGT